MKFTQHSAGNFCSQWVLCSGVVKYLGKQWHYWGMEYAMMGSGALPHKSLYKLAFKQNVLSHLRMILNIILQKFIAIFNIKIVDCKAHSGPRKADEF